MAFAGGVLKVTPFAADAVAPHNSFDLFRLSMDLIAGNFAALHALGGSYFPVATPSFYIFASVASHCSESSR